MAEAETVEASSSSRQNTEPSISVSTTNISGSVMNFHSSIGRLSDSAAIRRGRFSPEELAALPEVGERTIYVTDEGLIVSITASLNYHNHNLLMILYVVSINHEYA